MDGSGGREVLPGKNCSRSTRIAQPSGSGGANRAIDAPRMYSSPRPMQWPCACLYDGADTVKADVSSTSLNVS